jgi:hypothetical protein
VNREKNGKMGKVKGENKGEKKKRAGKKGVEL